MNFFPIEIVSEGASPLYADYEESSNFGKDVCDVLTNYNQERALSLGCCRFYFYFRTKDSNNEYTCRSWCKDRGGSNGYMFTRIRLNDKFGNVLNNATVTLSITPHFSGLKTDGTNIFRNSEIVNQKTSKICLRKLFSAQVVNKYDEPFNERKGSLNFNINVESAEFEVRYRMNEISKNIDNNLFQVLIVAYVNRSGEFSAYKALTPPIRVLSKPPNFTKHLMNWKAAKFKKGSKKKRLLISSRAYSDRLHFSNVQMKGEAVHIPILLHNINRISSILDALDIKNITKAFERSESFHSRVDSLIIKLKSIERLAKIKKNCNICDNPVKSNSIKEQVRGADISQISRSPLSAFSPYTSGQVTLKDM